MHRTNVLMAALASTQVMQHLNALTVTPVSMRARAQLNAPTVQLANSHRLTAVIVMIVLRASTRKRNGSFVKIVQLVNIVQAALLHLVMIVSVGTIQASGQPHVLTARQASTRMIMPAVVQIAVVAIIRVIMRTPVLSVQKVSTL